MKVHVSIFTSRSFKIKNISNRSTTSNFTSRYQHTRAPVKQSDNATNKCSLKWGNHRLKTLVKADAEKRQKKKKNRIPEKIK